MHAGIYTYTCIYIFENDKQCMCGKFVDFDVSVSLINDCMSLYMSLYMCAYQICI